MINDRTLTSITADMAKAMEAARDLMDAQPVPMDRRYVANPITGAIHGGRRSLARDGIPRPTIVETIDNKCLAFVLTAPLRPTTLELSLDTYDQLNDELDQAFTRPDVGVNCTWYRGMQITLVDGTGIVEVK